MNITMLIEEAFTARTFSYSPYSHFMVGACLLATDGTTYRGCNIENVAHTPTCCAERTAFVKAISEGQNKFEAICVVGGNKEVTEFDWCLPCGVCRQMMSEFCGSDFKIIVAKSTEEYKVYTLDEILPFSFDKNLV